MPAPLLNDFEVHLSRRGDKFRLHLPELMLVAEDVDLETAYRRLQTETDAIYNRLDAMGLAESFPKPRAKAAGPVITGREWRFAFRVGVLAIALIAIAGAIPVVVRAALPPTDGWVRKSVHSLAVRLQQADPQAKAQMTDDVRIIVKELSPLIDVLRGGSGDQ